MTEAEEFFNELTQKTNGRNWRNFPCSKCSADLIGRGVFIEQCKRLSF